jgi:hypothetical protein
VIVESFESLKKLQDNACAREEGNDEWWRRVIDLSIQRAPVEEASRLFFAEDRQQHLKDAAE